MAKKRITGLVRKGTRAYPSRPMRKIGSESGKALPLLLMKEWKDQGSGDRRTRTFKESIRAIHDVMQVAAHHPADVFACYSTLNASLRDRCWHEATGTTYGDQLRAILAAGGKVRILVLADLAADRPIAESLIDLLATYGVGPNAALQIVYVGSGGWADFPHFTIANRGDAWYGYVEWADDAKEGHPENNGAWNLNLPISAEVCGGSPLAKQLGESLKTLFNSRFHAMVKIVKKRKTFVPVS